MNSDTLLNNLEILSEAPGGIDRFRELIVEKAVRGELVNHSQQDPHQLRSLMSVRSDKGETIKARISGRSDLPRVPSPEEHPFECPPNWVFVRIDDTGEYINGCAFKASAKSETGLPIIRIQNLTNPQLPFNFTQNRVENKNIAEPGDLLVSWSATLNAFKWKGPKGAVNQHIFKVEPYSGITEPDFLYLILRWAIRRLANSDALHGLAMKHINRGHFVSTLVPIPPIAEQKRIVAKVDEIMDLCDQLEEAKNLRDEIRTATRKSAIDAISTATTPEELQTAWKRINNNWDAIADTPESAESLRGLILDLLMSGNLLAKNSQDSNWATKKFDDLGQRRLGKMLDKAKNTGELRPYLRNTNVQWFRIDKSDVANMRVSKNEVDEFTLKAGDLLICEGGQPGRCSIVGAAEEGLLFQKALHRFRPNDSTDVKFVAYSLLRASMNGTLEKLFTGVTIKHLTGQSLRGFEIAIPSINEQRRIVAEIDKFMALCDQLESELKSRSEVAEKFARSVISAA